MDSRYSIIYEQNKPKDAKWRVFPQYLFEGNLIKGYKVFELDKKNRRYKCIGRSKVNSINLTGLTIPEEEILNNLIK